MFRIACFCAFAIVSTNAIACGSAFDKLTAYTKDGKMPNDPTCSDQASEWHNDIQSEIQKSKEADQRASHDLDAKLQAQREYDQRERLAIDEDNRQGLIQGQLNQLNMNTVPLR